jgi:hypothetical protein
VLDQFLGFSGSDSQSSSTVSSASGTGSGDFEVEGTLANVKDDAWDGAGCLEGLENVESDMGN